MTSIGYGLVGAGAFGSFCIAQYRTSPMIDVRAVADVNLEAARTIAGAHGIDAHGDVSELLAREDIDLVHFATPPFTHKELVLQALAAGKHVLCEKPLTITAEDAAELVGAARAADRVLVVNHIMRYDPLNHAVKQILEQGLLGEPIAAMLTNLASDSMLVPEHWFWQPELSGGIFVEHSVHFFDLFSLFLGPATVLHATEVTRPANPSIVEQVQATALHDSGVLATQYHGFHQPSELDRQELRIVCERGDIRLLGWLTTHVEIDAMLEDATARRIRELFPQEPTVVSVPVETHDVGARQKTFRADARYRISATLGIEKLEVYGRAITALLEDQAAHILDRTHKRLLDESHGLRSLALAVDARRLSTLH